MGGLGSIGGAIEPEVQAPPAGIRIVGVSFVWVSFGLIVWFGLSLIKMVWFRLRLSWFLYVSFSPQKLSPNTPLSRGPWDISWEVLVALRFIGSPLPAGFGSPRPSPPKF